MNPNIRIGHGYDCHRLALPPEGGPLVLGGLRLEHEMGPVAHSDGDALLHAVTDAVLGALGLDDLGTQFPDNDLRWQGASSDQFLREAVLQAQNLGWQVGNVDATILLERPRLIKHRSVLRETLSNLLNVPMESVNVKGKSGEGLGPVGQGELVEVHASVLMHRAD
jgi:2-C-methyl-D-erythritol 2,4-cyclodiphosphate synthase